MIGDVLDRQDLTRLAGGGIAEAVDGPQSQDRADRGRSQGDGDPL